MIDGATYYMEGKKLNLYMYYISWAHENIDPNKSIKYDLLFDGASNVQLGGDLLKYNYPNITVMCGVEHTLY